MSKDKNTDTPENKKENLKIKGTLEGVLGASVNKDKKKNANNVNGRTV
ncbi:MAG: hypothetical protein Salg2KO_10950 [Salibacteraceae bacterium]